MKLVIDIPDGAYEEICRARFPIQDGYRLVTWIKDGTPLPKGHWINAEQKVDVQFYDEQYEEWSEVTMTIAEYLDRYTNEGCPGSIIEADTRGNKE